MKRAWFAILLAIVAASPSATAQIDSVNCAMVTYSDQWADGGGNLVVLNSSGGTWTYQECGSYTAYADVEINMPSGYSQSASATGNWDFAEAIASAPSNQEQGQVSISGSNRLDYDCGLSLLASFLLTENLWSCVGGGGVFSACFYTCYPQAGGDYAIGQWHINTIRAACSNVTDFCPYYLEARTVGPVVLFENAEIVKNSCQLYRQ